MIYKETERSRIWAVQMDNLRGLLGIKRMDGVRQLCGVTKGVDQNIDEGVLLDGLAMWREWRMII